MESFKGWPNSLADAILPKGTLGLPLTIAAISGPGRYASCKMVGFDLDSNRAGRSIKFS